MTTEGPQTPADGYDEPGGEYEDILYRVGAGIATVTLNRPDIRNAMSLVMQTELISALQRANDDSGVRVVVITGGGDAFSAGGDIRKLPADGPDVPSSAADGPYQRRAGLKRLQRMVLALRSCEKPVLAAVNGAAVGGGCDLALACDIRFASERARFGEVFSRIGLFPGTGGTYLLPRVVGIAKALELIWTGDVIDAEEAARIGLVSSVSPHEDLMPTVNRFARRLADGPPLALSLAKTAVYQGLDVDITSAFDHAATAEAITLSSADHAEGVEAFRQRRPPIFHGR